MNEPETDTYRRNYLLLVGEGILFTVGLVFFDPHTVLPLLMERLTASAILVGLVGAVEPLAKGLAPVLAGNWVRSLPHKKRFLIGAVSVGRLPLWILGLSLIWIAPANPLYWAGLLLAVEVLFWFGDAAGDPAWMDIVGKAIPGDQRGRFFAIRQVVGGLLSVLAGTAVAGILQLDSLPFPTNYGAVVCVGALIYTANVGAFLGIAERPGRTSSRMRVRELVFSLPSYLRRSRSFTMTMLVLLLTNLARFSLPFYIVFGRHTFGIGEAALGVLIPLQIAGRIAGGMLWGLLGDRRGHERAIRGVSLVCVFPPLLALASVWLAPEAPVLLFFSVLFFCLGMFLEGWSPFINYMLDIVPEGDRPLYAGLMTTGYVPVALAPVVGGIVIQALGYQPLFVATALITVFGFILATRLPPAERMRG